MNELLQIIFLSIIQGITEFLPISSSAHLIIFPHIFGWKDQGTFLDISMHFGSLLAVVYYFYKFQKGIFSSSNTSDFISIKKIIIGSLPVLIFGFIFYDYISLNFRSIGIISISTIFFAILLLVSEYFAKNNKEIIKKVKNAGSIFIGEFSPEAMGDYIAGPNHVLPTSGAAKFSSGLSVNDFLKRHSLIKISKRGIERLGPSVINLAQYENLEGHANSIKIRLKKEN